MTTSDGCLIRVKNLQKHYAVRVGNSMALVPALGGLTFDVKQGEFLSILGPTGCGKSTFLRIVSGLAEPTAGTVQINSQLEGKSQAELGVVFQSPALLPWLRVDANILLPAMMDSGKTSADRDRLSYLLRLVGLEEFARAYPHQLSVGMQQKVSLCRALIRRPTVLLMDEPFSALDAITRERFDLELSRVWGEERITALFVTHSISEAVFLSDRVVVLTDRPARVAAIVSIDLERPRVPAIIDSAPFVEYEKQLRSILNAGWEGAPDRLTEVSLP